MSINKLSHENAEAVSLALEYLDKLTTNNIHSHQRPAAIKHIRAILQGQLNQLNQLKEPALNE